MELARSKYRNYVDNVPDLNPADVAEYREDNNAIMADFASVAGVNVPGSNGEWRPIIDAGINYVDTRCDKFMDSLFWLNRVRDTTSRQIQYTGSAIGAALAVVEASKTAIGLTPLGFSLFDQTVNNLTAGLLYSLNPSTVRILVEKRQEAYVRSLTPSYTSKAIALRVIQGYAAICLPPSIEAEVERAIDAKEYTANTIFSALPPAIGDIEPTPFSFPEVGGVAKGAEVTSNPIVVTGIGSPAPISVRNGQYRIVGTARDWSSDAGLVSSGQHVQVKVVAPNADDSAASAILTIGSASATFTVRTAPAAGGAPIVGATPETAPAAPATEEGAPLVSSQEQNGIPNPD
jgi:hypothetical protein